jgi:hypothetical protein
MLVFGLVLIVLGALVLLGGAFATGHDLDGATFLGLNVPTQVIFFLGAFAAGAILWGFSIAKFGTKRELRHRRDQRRLRELSQKLDDLETGHRNDGGTDGVTGDGPRS